MINRKDIQNIEGLFMIAAVIEHESKRKAAEAIGASVDTINKYINYVEEELGFRLIISSGRGCKLTSEGKNIIKNVSSIKEMLDKMYNQKSESDKVSGIVRMGIHIGIGSNWVPNYIDNFFTYHPCLHLQTTVFQDHVNLKTSNLDIGISYVKPREKDVVILAERNIKCKLYASNNYLEQKGYPQNIEDIINNHRIVCNKNLGCYNKGYRELLKKSKRICYTSDSSAFAFNATKKGAGICAMPTYFPKEELVCLDNFNWESFMPIYLFVNPKTKDLPHVRATINYLKEILEKI